MLTALQERILRIVADLPEAGGFALAGLSKGRPNMAHIQKRYRGGQVRWIARAVNPELRELTKTFDRKIDAEHWVTTIEATKLMGE